MTGLCLEDKWEWYFKEVLFDSMSVIENVMFPLNMLTEQSDDEIIEKAKKAIERVELSKAVDKLPSEISGGMQKE